jgi:hypothetical protein
VKAAVCAARRGIGCADLFKTAVFVIALIAERLVERLA